MRVEEILNYIKCPYCDNQKLLLTDKDELVCRKCKKTFKVINGIPILMDKNCLNEQEKNQIGWFEKHYSQFSDKEYNLDNWRLSMLERIFKNDFSKNIKTYLDIGCGATGYTTIEAAKRNKLLSFGVDISLEAMLRAKALAKKEGVDDRTFFLVCSAENLPFKSSLFDYISAISLLEHLGNDNQVIKSVSKIVKKDGHFYICVPNTYKRIWPFLWPIYSIIDRKIGHKRHYSIENLDQKMQEAGFIRQDFFYNGHLIKLVQLILEKLKWINDKTWWKLEEKDIDINAKSLQLNALYRKK